MKRKLQVVKEQNKVFEKCLRFATSVFAIFCVLLGSSIAASQNDTLTTFDKPQSIDAPSNLKQKLAPHKEDSSSVWSELREKIEKLGSSKDPLYTLRDSKLTSKIVDDKRTLTKLDPELKAQLAKKKRKLKGLDKEIEKLVLKKTKVKVEELKGTTYPNFKKIFDAMDSNSDGDLSLQEFATSTKHPEATTHFESLDLNDDGTLSDKEFAQALKTQS